MSKSFDGTIPFIFLCVLILANFFLFVLSGLFVYNALMSKDIVEVVCCCGGIVACLFLAIVYLCVIVEIITEKNNR